MKSNLMRSVAAIIYVNRNVMMTLFVVVFIFCCVINSKLWPNEYVNLKEHLKAMESNEGYFPYSTIIRRRPC